MMRSIEIGMTGSSDEALSVSIDYRLEASPLVKKWRADRSVVDGISADIKDTVAEAFADPPTDQGEASERSREISERLRSLGRALFQEILKNECDGLRRWAAANAGEAPYIIFKIDKSLAHVPLEAMHDGEEFLSQRFAVGRVLYADDAGVSEPPAVGQVRTVLVVGDPSEDRAIRRDIERETDAVRDVFKRAGDVVLKVTLGREADTKYLLANLPGVAVLHFSGHGVVGQDDRTTGLRLHSDRVLSGYSLQGLQDAPTFAFLNVCTPASQETWKGSIGIIETLLRRGTRACVASLWDVGSGAAVSMPPVFYDGLLSGLTFGEALRQARCVVAGRFGLHDPTWASYALYGDPRLGLPGPASGRAARTKTTERMARRRLLLAAALATVAVALVIPTAIRHEPPPGPEQEPAAALEDSVPTPAPAVGYVVIESTPKDARILIDSEPTGVTPYAVEVPVGKHEIVIEKQGYRRWEATVEVRESPRVSVKATLEKTK
jgi:hypothetical protein